MLHLAIYHETNPHFALYLIESCADGIQGQFCSSPILVLVMSDFKVPDVHPDQVSSVGLLDNVVDRVSTHKRDVDVIPGDDSWVVVLDCVDEHDVGVVWRLRKTGQNKQQS